MKITLHQLKVFSELSIRGSVTKTAQALHMTQPGVSNIVRVLEEQLGIELIEVIRKKVFLTEAGKILANMYLKIQDQIDEGISRINLSKGIATGAIRIATVSTAKYFVPRLLGEFKALYPQIHVELKVKNREQIVRRLAENLDDFVIMSQVPFDSQIESQDFYEDELVIVSSPLHDLSKKTKINIKELANESWLIREQGSGTRIAMENIMTKYRVKPRIEMEIDNNESINRLLLETLEFQCCLIRVSNLKKGWGWLQCFQ